MAPRAGDDPAIPEVPWSDFWPRFCSAYGNGSRDDAQHVTIIGPTGTGKSTLAMQVANRRRWGNVLVSKPRDAAMRRMLREGGYRPAPGGRLPDAYAGISRVYFWPPVRGIDSLREQRSTFARVFDDAFRSGVWTTTVDEGFYLCETLGLTDRIRLTLQMGRSNGNGLILASHRPRWLPLDAFSAARHVFMFGTNDADDLRRLGGMNGVDDRAIRRTVGRLGKGSYRFLHVDTLTANMVISRFDK